MSPENAPMAPTLSQQFGLVKPNEQERTDRNLDFANVVEEGCLLIKLVLRWLHRRKVQLAAFGMSLAQLMWFVRIQVFRKMCLREAPRLSDA
jgi:hypothetical protein